MMALDRSYASAREADMQLLNITTFKLINYSKQTAAITFVPQAKNC